MHWLEQMQADHEATLTVGTRVKIDLGECNFLGTWHGTVEQGVTGVILNIVYAERPTDHAYEVLFDRPIPPNRQTWRYSSYELQPVPWPTPEELVRETLAGIDVDDLVVRSQYVDGDIRTALRPRRSSRPSPRAAL